MRFQLFISPLIITPLILAGVGTMARREAQESRNRPAVIGTVGLDAVPKLKKILEPVPSDTITFVSMEPDEIKQAIASREVVAAITFLPGSAERWSNEQTVLIQVHVDMSNEASRAGSAKVEAFLSKCGNRIVAERLSNSGISQQFVKPLEYAEVYAKDKGGVGVVLLSSMLPYLLVLYATIGGLFVANDSVAGEKERGTLESLLVTPISREELARGKFLAVACSALVSGLLALLGMLWPFYIKLPVFAWMTEGGAAFTGFQIVTMVVVLLPLSALGAGLLLTISTIARNQKEAQTWLGPMMLGVSVLSMLSLTLRPDVSLYVGLVPMLGPAMVIKQALQSVVNPGFIAVAAGSSAIYAGIAIAVAARLFMKESVLLRT